MMRFVARTAHYRAVSKSVAHRVPDDVWLERGRWNVSYEMHPGKDLEEEVALFQLAADAEQWRLLKAVRAQRIGDLVTVSEVKAKPARNARKELVAL
jgi:flagellar basal body L-ring protein FlgH